MIWVDCSSNRSGSELLEECRRACAVSRCSPGQLLSLLAFKQPYAVVFEFGDPMASHLQLLRSIKRQYPRVPILMITESHSEDLAVWAFRARVWNYLVKPVPLRELKANLRQLIKVAAERVETDARRVERPGAMLPAAYGLPAPQSAEASMQRIIECMQRDHASRLSITKLARECKMSRFSFSRLFRKTFGCSCREYLMRLRIETACTLLQSSDASVTGVAASAGFTDASYFARMFRRQMGASPTEYAASARVTKLELSIAME